MIKTFNSLDLQIKNKEYVGVSVKVNYDTDIKSVEIQDFNTNKRFNIRVDDISYSDICYMKRMLNI